MTQIDQNVPLPEVSKRTSIRGRKKKTEQHGAAGLLKALEFISLVQKSAGEIYQRHCLINNHWIVATDGVLTIGTKIEEDISACPRTNELLRALEKCGAKLSITQLNENFLLVKSGKFKAAIQCVKFEDLPALSIDPSTAKINDEIKTAFSELNWLINDGAQKAWQGALLLQDKSIVSCNGHVLLEYWHGLDLPNNTLIPKAAAIAISKTNKALISFGRSENSATFYFEDDSFLKTQLFNDNYPNYQVMFQKQAQAENIPLPKDFYTAINAVSSFCEDKFVHFLGNRISSHKENELGADYELDGIPNGFGFNFEYLKNLQPHFSNVFFLKGFGAFFQNNKVRGALAGMT